ncbi:MAG TPA: alpha/beta hydrolase [Candidatus Dormibacteraeota bacterium]|nr:alpha/beta hydrolase [Candidatus Dormibacteraeota bacterium]
MPHAEVNGQRIYYEDSGGAGLPLVLAHGLLMDHEMFAPQVAALGDRYRVVTWDERGHGLTESTADPFSYWDSADDLRGLLDALGIERAVIGGMSQGGFLSLRFALRHPERVIGLVLLDSQAGVEDPEKLPRYEMMVDVWTTEGANDQVADMVAATIIGPDRPESPAWIAKWKARPTSQVRQIFTTLATRDDITGRLGEIAAPALVVHGTDDIAIEPPLAETLAAGLPGAGPVVWVEGAAHAANLTHPEPVNAAVADFLRTLE